MGFVNYVYDVALGLGMCAENPVMVSRSSSTC